MTLHEQMTGADLDLFFDPDEHGEMVWFDGVEIPMVADRRTFEDPEGRPGAVRHELEAYIRQTDVGGLQVNQEVEIDGVKWRVAMVTGEAGVWKVFFERYGS